MARGRRAARLRAVANPMVAVAAAVVMVAAAATMLPVDDWGTSVPPAGSSTPAPDDQVVSCPAGSLWPGGSEPFEVATARLTGVAGELVDRALASDPRRVGVAGVYDTQGTYEPPLEFSPRRDTTATCEEIQVTYVARADILWNNTAGSVRLTLTTGLPREHSCEGTSRVKIQQYCWMFVTEGGVHVFSRSEKYVADGVSQSQVVARRPDATIVEVLARTRASYGIRDGRRDTEQPPLTVEQLQVIALDPRMTLYP